MQRPLFSIFGVPVSISIWHFLLLFMIGYAGDMRATLMFVIVGFFSILGHELGHALTCRAFRLNPRIELVTFGGMTYHEPAKRLRDDFLIVAAGPAVNFALGTIGLLCREQSNEIVAFFFDRLLVINYFWGAFNLLPVIPLDGGQLLRVLLLSTTRPITGHRWTHRVGIGVGLSIGVLALFVRYPLMGVMMLMFVYQNWQMLQAVEQSPDAKAAAKHGRVRELVEQAREAFAQGDFAATSRLAHLARAEPYVSQVELEHIWQLLALAAARTQQFDEALRYAERVPRSPEMALVQAHCLAMIGDAAKIQRFLSTPAALQLPEERVAELQELARQPQPGFAAGN